jgi:hypothetical protein
MCVPILDGEIVHFDREGKPQFFSLLGRRTPQHFVAFDLLRRSASRPTRSPRRPLKIPTPSRKAQKLQLPEFKLRDERA